MMMAFGQFVFSLGTLAFQELQRQISWRHPTTSRVGPRPARQFTGIGDDTLHLSGLLAPEFAGDVLSLADLEEMGNSGEQFPLVDGIGEVYGQYVIESLNTTGTYFTQDGRARRIEFQLQLARKDDDPTAEAAAAEYPAEVAAVEASEDADSLVFEGDDPLAADGYDGTGDDVGAWAGRDPDLTGNDFDPDAELAGITTSTA